MENRKNFHNFMKIAFKLQIEILNQKFLFIYIKWEDKMAKQSDIEKIKQLLMDQSTKLN